MGECVLLGVLLTLGIVGLVMLIRWNCRVKKFAHAKKHCNYCRLSYLDDKYKYCAVCGKELTEWEKPINN